MLSGSSATAQRSAWLNRSRIVILSMIVLQFIWLAAIWVTGATDDTDKLIALLVYSLVVSGVIWFLPVKWERMADFSAKWLEQREWVLPGIVLLLTFVFGVFYARQQRIWTWDEQFSLESARIVAKQGLVEFFDQYASIDWLGRQHPPLMPIINGTVMRVFGTELGVIRGVSLIVGAGVLLLTYLIGRKMYGRMIAFWGMVLLTTFPLLVRLSATGLLDVQVTLFFLLAVWLVLCMREKRSWWLALALGLVMGAGLLTKYTFAMLGPLLLLFWIIDRPMRQRTPQFALAAVVALALFGGWLYIAWQQGVLTSNQTVLHLKPGYFVSNSDGLKWLTNSLGTRLTSAIGAYNIPAIVLGIILLLRRRQTFDLFMVLWIVTITLVLIVLLPDHRYFMPMFPALALAMAGWLHARRRMLGQATLLSLLFSIGALWLLIDWQRAAELFSG